MIFMLLLFLAIDRAINLKSYPALARRVRILN
jgi:hypothetical protein